MFAFTQLLRNLPDDALSVMFVQTYSWLQTTESQTDMKLCSGLMVRSSIAVLGLFSLAPLSQGEVSLRTPGHCQLAPKDPSCPFVPFYRGPHLCVPSWPPGTEGGKVVKVAVLLPDRYYSSREERCVGPGVLQADYREVRESKHWQSRLHSISISDWPRLVGWVGGGS